MASDEVAIRIRVQGDEAAEQLEALGQQLEALGGAGGAGIVQGGLLVGGAEAERGRSQDDEVVLALRDLVGLTRLVAERIDQQRQVLERLSVAIAGYDFDNHGGAR